MHHVKTASVVMGLVFIVLGIVNLVRCRGANAQSPACVGAKPFSLFYFLLGAANEVSAFHGPSQAALVLTCLSLAPAVLGALQMNTARKMQMRPPQ